MGRTTKQNDILLVSLRSPFLDNSKVYPPLGLLYLKAALKEQGLDADIEDEFDPNNTNFDGKKYHHYSYVGASIMTPQRQLSNELLYWFRHNTSAITIAGGPHVQHYLRDIQNEPWHFLVSGDGEKSLPDIVMGRLKERVSKHYLRPSELQLMPRPDRLGNKELLENYNYELDGKRSTTMLVGRGCPMKCTFCEDANTPSRWTHIDTFHRELEDIVTLGYGGVYVFDDLFAISKRKIQPYLDGFSKNNLVYRCNGHAKFMDDEFAQMLSSSGCREIAFGAESGSQLILDNVKKETTSQQNYDFVQHCHKYGIKVKAFLMIGLPGETINTIRDTEDFIKNSGIDDFQLAIYYPFAGTQIRDSIDRGDNFVDIKFEGEGLGAYGQKGGKTESVVRTSALSSQQLMEERDRLVKTYKPRSHSQMNDGFFEAHMNNG